MSCATMFSGCLYPFGSLLRRSAGVQGGVEAEILDSGTSSNARLIPSRLLRECTCAPDGTGSHHHLSSGVGCVAPLRDCTRCITLYTALEGVLLLDTEPRAVSILRWFSKIGQRPRVVLPGVQSYELGS
eukprot:7644286-Pyramimonas_sp.AAC.3